MGWYLVVYIEPLENESEREIVESDNVKTVIAEIESRYKDFYCSPKFISVIKL